MRRLLNFSDMQEKANIIFALARLSPRIRNDFNILRIIHGYRMEKGIHEGNTSKE